MEETGLDLGGLDVEEGWMAVRDGGFLALVKRVTAAQDAAELRSRVLTYLRAQAQSEFCDVRVVRDPYDLDPRMSRFVVAYLQAAWRRQARRATV
jgi:hypothetical protein